MFSLFFYKNVIKVFVFYKKRNYICTRFEGVLGVAEEEIHV